LKRAAKEEAERSVVDLDAEDEEAVRQMLLQRAGFVRRLPDEVEQNLKGAGSALTSSNSSKRFKTLGPSAAAAALEEEEQEEEEEEEEQEEQEAGNEEEGDVGDLGGERILEGNGSREQGIIVEDHVDLQNKTKSKFQTGTPSFRASSRIITVRKPNTKGALAVEEEGSALLGLAGYGSGSSEGE
jgi:hypothetical protein